MRHHRSRARGRWARAGMAGRAARRQQDRMKSLSPYALPAHAAKRLLEIANGLTEPHGFVDIGQLNIIFLREGGSPDEYRAGIDKLKTDGLIDMHPSGARLTFTDKGAQRFA